MRDDFLKFLAMLSHTLPAQVGYGFNMAEVKTEVKETVPRGLTSSSRSHIQKTLVAPLLSSAVKPHRQHRIRRYHCKHWFYRAILFC